MSPRPDSLNLILAGLLGAIAALLAARPHPMAVHVIALPFAFLAGSFYARYWHQRKLCRALRELKRAGSPHRP
jgi:hypothetical protein